MFTGLIEQVGVIESITTTPRESSFEFVRITIHWSRGRASPSAASASRCSRSEKDGSRLLRWW